MICCRLKIFGLREPIRAVVSIWRLQEGLVIRAQQAAAAAEDGSGSKLMELEDTLRVGRKCQ